MLIKPFLRLLAISVLTVFCVTVIPGWLLPTQSRPDYDDGWFRALSLESGEEYERAGYTLATLTFQAHRDQNYGHAIKYFLRYIDLVREHAPDPENAVYRAMRHAISGSSTPIRQLLHLYAANYLLQSAILQRSWGSSVDHLLQKDPNSIDHLSPRELAEKALAHLERALEESGRLALFDAHRLRPQSKHNPVGREVSVLEIMLPEVMVNLESDLVNELVPEIGINADTRQELPPLATLLEWRKRPWKELGGPASLQQCYAIALQEFRYRGQGMAFVNWELRRLKHYFFPRNAFLPTDSEAYLERLEELENTVAGREGKAYVMGERARLLWLLANAERKRTDGDSARVNGLIDTAIQVCETCIDKHYDAELESNCRAIHREIMAPTFELEMPHVVPTRKRFPVMLNYRNQRQVEFSLVKLDRRTFIRNKKKVKTWSREDLEKMPLVQRWKRSLPKCDDHLSHRGYMFIPGLEPGVYALLITLQPPDGYELEEKTTQDHFLFQASGLQAINRRFSEDGSADLRMLDRRTGHPKAGVTVQQLYFPPDTDSSYVKASSISRSDGKVPDSGFASSRNRVTLFIDGADTLVVSEHPASRRMSWWNVDKRNETHLYLDRSLYRPGQTVYFKGIWVEEQNREIRLVTNRRISVQLEDANGQVLDSLKLSTNAFGSFAGSFVLPASGLTGSFRLQTPYSQSYMKVEEYKRPGFEVVLNPLSGSHRLNDSVTVTGQVKNYSGASVDGAEGKFTIFRENEYWSWRGLDHFRGRRASTRLQAGTFVTDREGRFSIRFLAQPKSVLNQAPFDLFNFRVDVTVTDQAGETQSGKTNVRIGRTDLELALHVPEWLDPGRSPAISLQTKTIAGQPLPTDCKWKVYHLRSPGRMVIGEGGHNPDVQLEDRAELLREWPHLPTEGRQDWKEDWKRGEMVAEGIHRGSDRDTLALPDLSEWKTGAYEIEVGGQDSFGNTAKRTARFLLSRSSDAELPVAVPLWVEPERTTAQPGETVNLLIGTGFQDAVVWLELEQDNKMLEKREIRLDRSKGVFPIEVTPDMLGGFAWRVLLLRNGRLHEKSGIVSVPFLDKILKVELATFRDKLLPGEEETWTLQISRRDGKPVQAEVLAALYDASLDAIYSLEWPNIVRPEQSQPYFRWLAMVNTDYEVAMRLYPLPGHTQPDYTLPGFPTMSEMRLMPRWALIFRGGTGFGFGKHRSVMRGGSWRSLDHSGASEMYNFFFMDDTEVDELSRIEAGNVSLAFSVDSVGMPPQFTVNASGFADLFGGGTQSLNVPLRKALQELAFFKPQLRTDSRGRVNVRFTVPESLTRWRFRVMAHTRDLATGAAGAETVTQKPLMVMPHFPRFLRNGDQAIFTARLINMSDSTQQGQAILRLSDAGSEEPLRLGDPAMREFSIPPGQSISLSWTLDTPSDLQGLIYRIEARADQYSDGEEGPIPVLPNKLLLTETLPLPVRPMQEKSFIFQALRDNTSTTLRHHKLQLEFTSNPAWYAVQALPYLMEFPHECAEQTFSRYYANALAAHVIGQHPRTQAMFARWQKEIPDGLLSALEKRQDLKMVLLEETPWVMEGRSETERKRRLGMLMDFDRLAGEQATSLEKLRRMQLGSGAFPWFSGLSASPFITQHIIGGFGHLRKMGVKVGELELKMLEKAVDWREGDLMEDHARRMSRKGFVATGYRPGHNELHYLYARSFFPEMRAAKEIEDHLRYLQEQAFIFWNEYPPGMQAQIALVAHRNAQTPIAKQIVQWFRKSAKHDEELGMFWEWNNGGWLWSEAHIENQARMIELFQEVSGDESELEEMRLWLLKMKQVQNWKTTKATAYACYALLMGKTNYLAEERPVEIYVGGERVGPGTVQDYSVEPGIGQVSGSWPAEDIRPELADVRVKNRNKVASWGAIYWQYFEEYDQVKVQDNTPLKLKREVFREVMTEAGPRQEPVLEGTLMKPGDKLRVRLALESDRSLEFVHLRDQRPAALEPVNQLSGAAWTDGVHYYQSPRDAATHFFIDFLPAGKFVFRYELKVSYAGEFSGGLSTAQCMYAPEFAARSAGQRIVVEE